MRPKSSSETLIWRRSGARIVPSVISSSYWRPVRLSVTLRLSRASPGLAPSTSSRCFVSGVAIAFLCLAARVLYPIVRHRDLRCARWLGARGLVAALCRRDLSLVMAAQLRVAVGTQRRRVERHERELGDRQPRIQLDRDAREVGELERQRPLPARVAEARR